jgi:hypothetical protein
MTLPAPILGSMKHAKLPKIVNPNPNTAQAVDDVIKALDAFEVLLKKWGEKSTKHGKYNYHSHLRVGRSLKTGKILLSESRDQKRSGHDELSAAMIKPQVIEAFHAFETALLTVPVFAHPETRLNMTTYMNGRVYFTINECGILGYGTQKSLREILTWIIDMTANASVTPDSPLWIVDKNIFPAEDPLSALIIHNVCRAAGENKEDKQRKLLVKTNIKVGLWHDIEPLKGDLTKSLLGV